MDLTRHTPSTASGGGEVGGGSGGGGGGAGRGALAFTVSFCRLSLLQHMATSHDKTGHDLCYGHRAAWRYNSSVMSEVISLFGASDLMAMLWRVGRPVATFVS